MTLDDLRNAPSDGALYDLLASELESRIPDIRRADDHFVEKLKLLPRGLRAMAATYDLDVSFTLDNLGWHFGNWHHLGLAQETLEGLRELGADRLAELFDAALQIAQRYWDSLASPNWSKWYHGSAMEKEIEPVNREASQIWDKQPQGLFSYWLSYARRYPERLL